MKRSAPLKRRTPLKKKSATSVSKLKDRLWELCKQITRLTYGNVCYTCGATNLQGSNWHTGHFITDSTCSTELSYDLRNLRPQCYACNIHKSGNWVAFEQRLLKDEGPTYIVELKYRNQVTKHLKYDAPWYEAKIAEYERILSRLQSPGIMAPSIFL